LSNTIAIFNSQINQLRSKYPNDRFSLDEKVLNILNEESISSTLTSDGIVQIETIREKTI
jgi:hypothetical protein